MNEREKEEKMLDNQYEVEDESDEVKKITIDVSLKNKQSLKINEKNDVSFDPVNKLSKTADEVKLKREVNDTSGINDERRKYKSLGKTENFCYTGESHTNDYANKKNSSHSISVREIDIVIKRLRSEPVLVKCPYCRSKMLTRVEKKCSIPLVLCSIFTTPIGWLIYQKARGKDLKCSHATHYCANTNCMNKLGSYKA